MINNHFDPVVLNLKQLTNYKEKITPESFFKNLNKNQILIENFF